MVTITGTSTHLKFTDGGNFQLEVPKSMITLARKGDYIIYGLQATGAGPETLKYHYSDIDSPSAGSAADMYVLLSAINASAASQVFTATASQTVFTVTDFTLTQNAKVFVAGALVSTGYTISGQDVTFSVGIPLSTSVVIVQ